MSTTTESVESLIEKYMTLISKDHHKDRDCHFLIQKAWSYGKLKGYTVVHDGYVNKINEYRWSHTFKTYKEAEDFLKEVLKKWIEEEENLIEENSKF